MYDLNKGNGIYRRYHNLPRPGEVDVEVYHIDRNKGMAFARIIDYEKGGWIVSPRDRLSPSSVAMHYDKIKDDGWKRSLRNGARFRVILSRTREGSSFDYFGAVVASL